MTDRQLGVFMLDIATRLNKYIQNLEFELSGVEGLERHESIKPFYMPINDYVPIPGAPICLDSLKEYQEDLGMMANELLYKKSQL